MTRGFVSRTYAPTVVSSGRGRASRGSVDCSIGYGESTGREVGVIPTTIVADHAGRGVTVERALERVRLPASRVTVPVAVGLPTDVTLISNFGREIVNVCSAALLVQRDR